MQQSRIKTGFLIYAEAIYLFSFVHLISSCLFFIYLLVHLFSRKRGFKAARP